jgi:hypothetical protein
MIRLKCPKCEKVLGLDETKAGQPALCPSCKQKFMVPGKPAKAPAGAAGKSADQAGDNAYKKPGTEEDDFTPYTMKNEGPAKPIDDGGGVDDMIRFATLQRKRERAWKEVGTPAKLMKMLALFDVAITLAAFLYLTVITVLFLHQLKLGKADVRPLLLVADVRGENYPAGIVWGVGLGIFIIQLVINGFILSGAEKMKRLESWGMGLTAAILSILFHGILGVGFGFWAISTLMNKDVKLEFEKAARARRRQELGLDPEDDDELDEDEEEDDDEDDEEDEDEEDDEEEED